MKSGKVIEQLVKNLSQNKPVDKPESFVRYQLKIDIDPKYKAFSIFLLNLVNEQLGYPYSDI